MARRANSKTRPLWIVLTLGALVLAIAVGALLQNTGGDPFRTVPELDLGDYLNNANSLRGNVYKVKGQIMQSLGYSRAKGRLFSVEVDGGTTTQTRAATAARTCCPSSCRRIELSQPPEGPAVHLPAGGGRRRRPQGVGHEKELGQSPRRCRPSCAPVPTVFSFIPATVTNPCTSTSNAMAARQSSGLSRWSCNRAPDYPAPNSTPFSD